MNNEQKQYNLTLEPEMATDSLLSGSVPTLASVKSKTAPKRDSYSVGTIDESMLSEEEKAIVETKTLHEDKINSLFIAVTEGVEEAVLSSMLHADTVVGRNGRVAHSLTEYMDL